VSRINNPQGADPYDDDGSCASEDAVENLRLCVQGAYNVTFPMGTTFPMGATFPVGTVDNLFAIEEFATKEHLRALLARHRAVVTEAIYQGVATVLATTQL
jgi:hypothetical protein